MFNNIKKTSDNLATFGAKVTKMFFSIVFIIVVAFVVIALL